MSSRGTSRENLVKDWLEERGWWVCRAAGSLGDADLACMRRHPGLVDNYSLVGEHFVGQPGKLLVEVKSTKAGPFSDFGPKDRAELLEAGRKADADVVLCWVPPQAKPFEPTIMRWYWPEDWPKTAQPAPQSAGPARGDGEGQAPSRRHPAVAAAQTPSELAAQDAARASR
jgi:hypothetical protein